MADILRTYFSLCGTLGQLLGMFLGAIVLAAFTVIIVYAGYIFISAFIKEITRP
jgi:hypothetical protein